MMFGTYVDPKKVSTDFALGLDTPVDPKQIPRMLAGL